MKIAGVCLIVISVCSGCQNTSDTGSGDRDAMPRRLEQMSTIIKNHYDSKYEFEIRGPLSITEVGEELGELHEEAAEIKRRVYGHVQEFEDSELGKAYTQLKRPHKDGDELYCFTSDEQSWCDRAGIEGYVLIRRNEIVDGIVTNVN